MAHHACAAADVALERQAAPRAVERGEHVLRCDMESADVIERAVVGLRDHRKPPRLQRVLQPDFPADDRVAHDAHAVGVRDGDRPLEQTAFLHPGRPGHLAVAVQREPGREHRIGIRLAPRMHDGDAGAHGALPLHQPPAARDERRVPDLHAGDIGDGVEGARRAANRQSEFARPRLLRLGRYRHYQHAEHRDSHHRRSPSPPIGTHHRLSLRWL